jgi:plasmid stabilization system protein ParE
MVLFKIIWQPSAKKQLVNTLDYFSIRNKNTIYSKKLLKSVIETIANLSTFPNLGKPTEFETVRELIHLNYSIFYVFDSKKIDIVHFWDNRRNRDELEKELNSII